MPGYTSVAVSAPSGIVWIEQREMDTSKVIRRFRAPDEQQPGKVRAEREMEEQFGDWQRWKLTREEAQSRALPGAVVTALTNRENAAWTAYAEAIQRWRQAP